MMPSKQPDRRFELYSVPSFETGKPERLPGYQIGSSKQAVKTGAVLLCRINPRINRVWVVGEASRDPQIASTEWVSLGPVEEIAPRFLMYALQTPSVREYLTSNVSGVGGSLMRIRMGAIWRTRVPLAPIPEQQRIVASIEGLFAKLNAGVDALRRVQANLERYRASVLKAAVEGSLTAQWRKQNPPKESGEELLERILTERRRRWENEQTAKFEARRKKPPRNWRSKFKEPATPDASRLLKLPEGWCWATVGQLAKTMTGGTPSRKKGEHFGGNIPWIKSGELSDGPVSQHEESLSPLGLAESSANVFPIGTLCIALYGATVGRIGILEIEAATNQAICGIVNPSLVYPEYLAVSFLANRHALVGRGRGGAQSNISQEIVRDTAVPVPPRDEQVAIMREVDRLLSESDSQRETLSHLVDVQVTTLRQSILKRAFAGRLVPQDPDDEPASIFLRRIRTKREVDKKKRHAATRNRTKS